MKADNFVSYLQEPSLLEDISYQELKSMVVQYPYCQNLRYLLVTKSHMDNRNEYESDLHLASTYSIDRNFLFKHLHQEAYTQSTTESLVLENEPVVENSPLEIPEEVVPIIAAAPIAKEILSSDNVAERRTIRIQSENAKLYAEEKAGLTGNVEPTEENTTNSDFIDKILEVEDRMDASVDNKLLNKNAEDNIPNENLVTDTPATQPKSLIDEIMEDEANEPLVEAEPVSDKSKLITYIEKPEPKESRSIIDQLMQRNMIQQDGSLEEINDRINLEDELESLPNTSPDLGETPPNNSYDEPKVKEVIFEITNEMDSTEEETDSFVDEINEKDGDEAYSDNTSEYQEDELPDPVPKSSFKDWKEKFLPDPSEDPPTEVSIEEILRTEEEEDTIETVIKEEVKEEKKKKGKKKKKKDKNKKEEGKKKDKKKKKKKKKVLDIAKKSIQKNDDIISETLAELLVKQGSRKKAIQMYERLSLIFPEKSTFFAKKIENLKK